MEAETRGLLIEKIENYLKETIAEINRPLHVCDKCKGKGYIND